MRTIITLNAWGPPLSRSHLSLSFVHTKTLSRFGFRRNECYKYASII